MSSLNKRDLRKTNVFTKDLNKLPKDITERAWDVAQTLVEDVFHRTLSIRKLEKYENVWRVKVKQDYRLIYTFD